MANEKQGNRAEIAEKVKVKKERQSQADQKALGTLEKEQKSERVELMEEMWTKAAATDAADDEEESDNDKTDNDNKQAVPNNHDQSAAPPPPSAPDCPVCFESMTPPMR